MFEEHAECLRLDAKATISLSELADCCGMTVAELDELVDYNALVPLDLSAPERSFGAHWVMPLRAAARLRFDFDLDIFTVAIVLGHFDRIAHLEQQVQSLQALLPRHLSDLYLESRNPRSA